MRATRLVPCLPSKEAEGAGGAGVLSTASLERACFDPARSAPDPGLLGDLQHRSQGDLSPAGATGEGLGAGGKPTPISLGLQTWTDKMIPRASEQWDDQAGLPRERGSHYRSPTHHTRGCGSNANQGFIWRG